MLAWLRTPLYPVVHAERARPTAERSISRDGEGRGRAAGGLALQKLGEPRGRAGEQGGR